MGAAKQTIVQEELDRQSPLLKGDLGGSFRALRKKSRISFFTHLPETRMDVITLSVMIAGFALACLKESPPPKSSEQLLGEALGKYLEKGVTINVNVDSRKQEP
ncbi:MAG: hypothetical protein SNJ81_12135 [Cyanobacteriota bacterium]